MEKQQEQQGEVQVPVQVQEQESESSSLKAKLQAQEDELTKLRQLNELLLEQMNKKGKKKGLPKSLTGAGEGGSGEQEYEGFEVKKVPIKHELTQEVIDFEYVVTIKDQQLIAYLRNFVVRRVPRAVQPMSPDTELTLN
jgi:hypothetical protein